MIRIFHFVYRAADSRPYVRTRHSLRRETLKKHQPLSVWIPTTGLCLRTETRLRKQSRFFVGAGTAGLPLFAMKA